MSKSRTFLFAVCTAALCLPSILNAAYFETCAGNYNCPRGYTQCGSIGSCAGGAPHGTICVNGFTGCFVTAVECDGARCTFGGQPCTQHSDIDGCEK